MKSKALFAFALLAFLTGCAYAPANGHAESEKESPCVITGLTAVERDARSTETTSDGAQNTAGVCGGQLRFSTCVNQGVGIYFTHEIAGSEDYALCRFDRQTGALSSIGRLTSDNEKSGAEKYINVCGGYVFFANSRGNLFRLSLENGKTEAYPRSYFVHKPFVISENYVYYSAEHQDPRLPGAQKYSPDNLTGSIYREELIQPTSMDWVREKEETLIEDGMYDDYFSFDGGTFFAVEKVTGEICAFSPDGIRRTRTGAFPAVRDGWFAQNGMLYYILDDGGGQRVCVKPARDVNADTTSAPLLSVLEQAACDIDAPCSQPNANARFISDPADNIAFYGVSDDKLFIVQNVGNRVTVEGYSLENGEKETVMRDAQPLKSTYEYALSSEGCVLIMFGGDACVLADLRENTYTLLEY